MCPLKITIKKSRLSSRWEWCVPPAVQQGASSPLTRINVLAAAERGLSRT